MLEQADVQIDVCKIIKKFLWAIMFLLPFSTCFPENENYGPLVLDFPVVPRKLGGATPEVKGTRPPPLDAFPLPDVFAPPRVDPPRVDPPRVDPPRVDPPRVDPPRVEKLD
jgi:hypothetical protein